MKTGRKPTPATAPLNLPMNEQAVKDDMQSLNQLALANAQHDSAVRAVALQMGYMLPADCTDPDLIQRDISANMRRSVEACLEVGKGLRVLKVACGHGNFMARLDVLGIDVDVAGKFMQVAKRLANSVSTRNLSNAVSNQTKLFEILILDDAQIEELELTGQTGELALDDIATMSVKELRHAVREARADKTATDKILSDKNAKIDKLSRHIKKATPDQKLAELQKEATEHMHDALGCIRGQLRDAFGAIRNHSTDDHDIFLAGLLGQLQAEVTAVREDFTLPDVSTVAEQELASDVAQWSKKKTK